MNSNSPVRIIPAPSPASLAGTNDVRPPPQTAIPDDLAWLWWTLGALAVAVAAWLAWRWWRRQQQTPAPVVFVPAHVRARQRLAEALRHLSEPRTFCILVSDALRVYLEECFDFRAPERTTDEFLVELQASKLLTTEQKRSLGEFLQSCDLVKFARFEPTEAALRELHECALRLVDETQFHEAAAKAVRAAALASSAVAATKPRSQLAREVERAARAPVTAKDRLTVVAVAVAIALSGAAMCVWPDLITGAEEASGRGGRRVLFWLRLLDWVWSRPLGIVLILAGGYLVYAALTWRKEEEPA